MDLRGLEMLLALTGGILLFGFLTGGPSILGVVWAGVGIGTILLITAGLMGALFPYLKETQRWERFNAKGDGSLVVHSRGGVEPPSLSGRMSQCDVTISPVNRDRRMIVCRPSSANAQSYEIFLSPRTDGDAPSFSLGDPLFDTQFTLQGSLPEMVAALDWDTRKSILELMHDPSIRVRGRRLVKWGRHLERDHHATWQSLERMVSATERLFGPLAERTEHNLGVNAEQDPEPVVRALNLRLLFEYYPPGPRTLAIGRRALESDQVECVLAAAIGLAEDGNDSDKARAFEHLTELAQLDFSDAIRSPAIKALAASYGERAHPVLNELASADGPLPSELLFALADAGFEPNLGLLIPRAHSAPGPAQVALSRRLREDGTRFEAVAIALLDSTFERVQLEVMTTLGGIGSICAVEKILPFTKGILRSQALRDAAQHALHSIQARLRNADRGQLSMGERPHGELSLD